MILEKFVYKDYHNNGSLWTIGDCIVVSNSTKHLYNYFLNFNGYEGKNVVRVGLWRKYYDNGQIAWTLDYSDGTTEKSSKSLENKFTQYRKDGSIINY